MVTIKVSMVPPKYEGGPKLWEARINYEPPVNGDKPIVAYGESLSLAISRLGRMIGMREWMDGLSESVVKDHSGFAGKANTNRWSGR